VSGSVADDDAMVYCVKAVGEIVSKLQLPTGETQ
jgi:hypothetical protein